MNVNVCVCLAGVISACVCAAVCDVATPADYNWRGLRLRTATRATATTISGNIERMFNIFSVPLWAGRWHC